MRNFNSFDDLIQKALETDDFPPIPASLLLNWQPKRTENGAKWLWIMPSVVFIFGISIGVWLAPLGLSNAFSALANAWNGLSGATLAWAAAVIVAIVAFSFDGLRKLLRRN